MKTKLLLITSLLLAAFKVDAQTVEENFNKADLSDGSLACWQSEYAFQPFGSARVAAPAAQSLDSDSRLSLNSGSSISGSASLRVTESFTILVHEGAESVETLISPALGQDGDLVSFKIRVNSASMPAGMALHVVVTSGSFSYEREILASEFNSTLNVATTIGQSMGGGVIKVAVRYSNYGFMPANTTVSYSLDIDDFSTEAELDPSITCTSLPVTLASFSAKRTENAVKLNWSTSQETKSDRFEIHRSADAKQWTAIGTELSSGENTGLLNYHFTDFSPLSGTNYYRLKMIDQDGTYAYSSIRSVESGNIGMKTVLYPNPVVDKIFIQDMEGNELANGQVQEISIRNLKGTEVFKSTPALLASNSGINVNGISTGMYVLKVKLTDGTQSTHKILVNK